MNLIDKHWQNYYKYDDKDYEKVEKLGIERDNEKLLYYVKSNGVWAVNRSLKSTPKKIADIKIEMDKDFIYFLDKDGDISRVEREKTKPTVEERVRGLESKVEKLTRYVENIESWLVKTFDVSIVHPYGAGFRGKEFDEKEGKYE